MNWHNASKSEPCPVCHKTDWCTMSNDGAVCVCRRVESPHPCKSGMGWIHRLTEERIVWREPPKVERQEATPDFQKMHDGFDGHPIMQDGLSFGLGLEAESFAALDVRYNAENECMSFPMRDHTGRITGLRYRHLTSGKKWSAKGSKDGLFYDPRSILTAETAPDSIVVTEGPTDTAAALSLGLDAIGRSSCMTGAKILREIVMARRIRRITIFADGDRPGMDGARRLARELSAPARIVLPPPGIKDLREWYNKGLRIETFRAAESAATET